MFFSVSWQGPGLGCGSTDTSPQSGCCFQVVMLLLSNPDTVFRWINFHYFIFSEFRFLPSGIEIYLPFPAIRMLFSGREIFIFSVFRSPDAVFRQRNLKYLLFSEIPTMPSSSRNPTAFRNPNTSFRHSNILFSAALL